MHIRNRAMQRRHSRHMLAMLLATLFCALIIHATLLTGSDKRRLQIVDSFTVPLKEISGLSVYSDNEFLVVGDAAAEIIQIKLENPSYKFSVVNRFRFSEALYERFSLCAQSRSAFCRLQRKLLTSDWEAVAVRGQRIYVLQEHSSALVSFLAKDPLKISVNRLHFSDSNHDKDRRKAPLRRTLKKDAHLAEGMVLVSQENILAVRELNPASIIRLRRQANGDFVEEKSWQWNERRCDISELFQHPKTGDLYLLSQECRKVVLLEPLSEDSDRAYSRVTWKIPNKVKNPEAMVVLPGPKFLIGSDDKKVKKHNLFLLVVR